MRVRGIGLVGCWWIHISDLAFLPTKPVPKWSKYKLSSNWEKKEREKERNGREQQELSGSWNKQTKKKFPQPLLLGPLSVVTWSACCLCLHYQYFTFFTILTILEFLRLRGFNNQKNSVFRIKSYTFSFTFSNEEGETTEKHTKKTSVCG